MKEEELREDIQRDKEKLEKVIAIFNKVLERLNNGEKVSEIEEAMSEELDRADTLIGEVYFG